MTTFPALTRIDPAYLCNPYTGEPLKLEGSELVSAGSGQRFPLRQGIPSFVGGAKLPPRSRFMRWFYDRAAFAYDLTMELGPRLHYGTEASVREEVVGELPIHDGEAVLETAAGTCLNLAHIPATADYHGLDISWNMLRRARRNLAGWGRTARLYQADAQFLPFHDDTFDHVFQMGGLQFIADPFLAVREMARVARRGATITILDEASGAKKTFKRLPAHAQHAADLESAMRGLRVFVPHGMEIQRAELLPSGEFYCLSFRKAA